MAEQVSAIEMEKNPQYCSSVVKSAILDFDGISVSIFRNSADVYINP
ncbi:MAG: hypothetical protein Q8930_18035 [Bacillota bacterium]|nr:hypothetical protein [Bacillota bacterium]